MIAVSVRVTCGVVVVGRIRVSIVGRKRGRRNGAHGLVGVGIRIDEIWQLRIRVDRGRI